MSRPPTTFEIPAPPPGLLLSPVPDKTLEQAVEWINTVLGPKVTERYLKSQTDKGELRTQVITRCRYYSTSELYRFILSRGQTAKAKPKAAKASKRESGPRPDEYEAKPS